VADIAVQRGSVDYTSSGTTITPGTTYGALSSAFVRSTNNRKMNAGPPPSTGNQPIDDLGLGLAITATNTITVTAEPGSNASTARRVYWESWEYTGPSGGAYEFIVRSRNTVTLTGETNTATLSETPSDIDNCIPFITGIRHDGTSSNFADCAAAIAWLSGSNTLNVKRGGTNGTVTVTVTTVEFIGSAWSVAHGRTESAADSGTITLVDSADGTTAGGGDVGNWSNAAIFHQFSGNNSNGVDDALADTSATYEPGSNTTSVDWTFNGQHVDSAGAGDRGVHMVHTLSCADMAVTRVSDSQSHTGAANVSISGAGLSDISEAGLIVSRNTSGGGNAYARGWVNARITSTTNVELWCHRNGNSIQTRLQVLDFSGMEDSGSGEQTLEHTIFENSESFGSAAISASYEVQASLLQTDGLVGDHSVGQSGAPQSLSHTTYVGTSEFGGHTVLTTYDISASTVQSTGGIEQPSLSTSYPIVASVHVNNTTFGEHEINTAYGISHTILTATTWIGTPTVTVEGQAGHTRYMEMNAVHILDILGIK
jgi:hypothetical protein